jgi:hypothetical protein
MYSHDMRSDPTTPCESRRSPEGQQVPEGEWASGCIVYVYPGGITDGSTLVLFHTDESNILYVFPSTEMDDSWFDHEDVISAMEENFFHSKCRLVHTDSKHEAAVRKLRELHEDGELRVLRQWGMTA